MLQRRGRSPHPVWLVLACAVAVALGGEWTPVAGAAGVTKAGSNQERPRKPGTDGLLERFPLGTSTVDTTPSIPERPPVVTLRISPEDLEQASEGNRALWVALAGGAGALGLLAVFGAWRVRQLGDREGGAARPFREPGQTLRLLAVAPAKQECDGSSSGFAPSASRPARRSLRVSEPSQDRNPKGPELRPVGPEQPRAEQSERSDGPPPSHAEVGVRISGILEAAEAAAAQIREEAVAAAAGIEERAKRDAGAHIQKAEEDAATLRSEAEAAAKDTRSAAESFGTRQRREAEDEARKVLAEAEAQARATRQAAEGMAKQIEVAAHEREEVLRAQIGPLEAKLQRALEGCRAITNQLEELLEGTNERGGRSLVDALGAATRQPASWEEKA